MKLFFDLDGTLLDSRERLYKLFQFLVPESTLGFDEYWELKRNKNNHRKILHNLFSYSEERTENFEKEWFAKIEQEEWLAFDKPFEGITDFLIAQKEIHQLYLVTARQFEEGVTFQLAACGWGGIFDKIFVTHQSEEKAGLIKGTIVTKKEDWFIGDTGKDIEAGKILGIKTAGVLSGFRNRESLEKYKPTVILNSVLDLPI